MLNWLETKLKDKDPAPGSGAVPACSQPAVSPRGEQAAPHQEKATYGGSAGGGGKMNEKMQMQDRLVDLVEENKGTYRLPLCSLFSFDPKAGPGLMTKARARGTSAVLKQQILVLRDLEKKNASEIATLRTEVDSWKVQAFQMVSKTSEADEKSILESPEYRKLEAELQQLRKLKTQYEKQISDQTQRLTEVERQLKASQDKEKALYDAAEKKYRDEIAGLLQQLKDKDDEIKKHTLENATLLDKNKEARARPRSQHAIEVLREHVEGQQNEINVLVERVSRQASLPSQTRSVTEIHDIEVFRKKFNLPPTEFCIVYYACTYKHAWGYIYISPNFLCFEATFSSTKLVLALIEIKALHKIKKGFIPGTGTVAEIVTRDGKPGNWKSNQSGHGQRHELRGMMQRKEALLDIYRQMVKSNIPVKTYRDGKEETLKLS